MSVKVISNGHQTEVTTKNMTGLPCTCILENIKYSASSDVRFRAGCSQNQEVNVVKRNKDLASGELIVFVPSHRKRENVNAESSAMAENVSQDSRIEERTHSCVGLFLCITLHKVQSNPHNVISLNVTSPLLLKYNRHHSAPYVQLLLIYR